MKAAKLLGCRNLQVVETPTPVVQPGWVLIKVLYCGICGSDVQKYTRTESPAHYLSTNVLGHEILGKVWKTDCDNTLFTTGDIVVVMPLLSCGECACCRSGHVAHCVQSGAIGRTVQGGFAEYVLTPYSNVRKVPVGADPIISTLADPMACALHMIQQPDTSVVQKHCLVIGDGAIGLALCLALDHNGGDVTLVSTHELHRELAFKLGIKAVDLSEGMEFINKFDLVFECVGRRQADTLNIAISACCPQGKIIIGGVYDFEFMAPVYLREIGRKELHICGANSFRDCVIKSDFMDALTLLHTLESKARLLCSMIVPLSEIAEAFELLSQRLLSDNLLVKILVTPEC